MPAGGLTHAVSDDCQRDGTPAPTVSERRHLWSPSDRQDRREEFLGSWAVAIELSAGRTSTERRASSLVDYLRCFCFAETHRRETRKIEFEVVGQTKMSRRRNLSIETHIFTLVSFVAQ